MFKLLLFLFQVTSTPSSRPIRKIRASLKPFYTTSTFAAFDRNPRKSCSQRLAVAKKLRRQCPDFVSWFNVCFDFCGGWLKFCGMASRHFFVFEICCGTLPVASTRFKSVLNKVAPTLFASYRSEAISAFIHFVPALVTQDVRARRHRWSGRQRTCRQAQHRHEVRNNQLSSFYSKCLL